MAPETYAEKDVKKRWSEDTPRIMGELVEVLRGIADFSSKPSEDIVIGWITEKGYHMGNVMNAFRLAVVGECKGPNARGRTCSTSPSCWVRKRLSVVSNVR